MTTTNRLSYTASKRYVQGGTTFEINAKILLADEPTGALDSKNSIKIMKILKKLSKNRLVIMVTHNEELARKYARRIIRIKDGNIIEDIEIRYLFPY